MDYSVPEVTSAEREFYGENLILLEGAILRVSLLHGYDPPLRGAAGKP